MRYGCTGHQNLSPATRRAVAAAIADVLAEHGEESLVGLSSLAEGADQLFAFAVLAAGGQLHAVIPSHGYEQSFASDETRSAYSALLNLAAATTTLPFMEPGQDAYLAAGQAVADRCETLLAVWDGQGAAGRGGTGDIVTYAREQGTNVTVIWPDEAQRQ